MMAENTWRRVRVDAQDDGGRVVLLSGVFSGVRLWSEVHWSVPGQDGTRRLLHERFWGSDPGKVHRTAEAALEAELNPEPAGHEERLD